jgi:multidrug efflux pump subunit AcrB
VLAFALIPLGLVGFEYIPPVDRGEIYLTVTYPSGTPLETTRRARWPSKARRQSPDVQRRVVDGRRLSRADQRLHQ